MEKLPLSSPDPSPEDMPKAPARVGILRRLAHWWLQFSGPRASSFSTSLEDQERSRRSLLLSVLFPFYLVAAIIVAPTAIPVPTYWIPVLCLLVLSSIALLFNRLAHINLSGLFLVLAVDLTLIISFLTLPDGIRNSTIPDFDLFLLSLLVGSMVLRRRVLPFLAALHIVLILVLFRTLPHNPLLTEEIKVNQGGFAYSEISDAILIQVIGTIIAWLSAWSVDKALTRASRAEELAEARRNLSKQALVLAGQKERLEYGISLLKEAHARFAGGDYRARANLQDNELASLALSFNLLAERLNRVAHVAQDHERLEMAVQQFLVAQDTIVHGGDLKPLPLTGTQVDRLYPWLKQYTQIHHVHGLSSATMERLRQNLMRQRTLLTQLLSALDQVHGFVRQFPADAGATQTLVQDFVEKAQRLCKQVEEQEKSCLQETRQLEQLFRSL